jgi:hypothetical protein
MRRCNLTLSSMGQNCPFWRSSKGDVRKVSVGGSDGGSWAELLVAFTSPGRVLSNWDFGQKSDE